MSVKKSNGIHSYSEICQIISEAIDDDVSQLNYGSANNNYGFVNRPSWFPQIRQLMFKGLDWSSVADTPTTECPSCHFLMTPQACQIDHETPWLDYINSFNKVDATPMTNLQARILYNSPQNLRLICSICNGSHPELRPLGGNTRGKCRDVVMKKIQFLFGEIDSED